MQRTSGGSPDDGQRGGPGMRASFGAAGDVDRRAVADERGGALGDPRRQGASGDVRGGADRRAGAGHDMPARIVGADDEAKLLGGGGQRWRGLVR